MGIPIIEALVGDDRVRIFFDTSAKLSYLNPDTTAQFPSVGTAQDFYPGIGEFSTKIYAVPIVLGTEQIMLRVSNLPDPLRASIMLADTAGISWVLPC